MTQHQFTIEQIKQAHSKVKSGADFPRYIRDIKALGVRKYTTWLYDRHTDYEGGNGYVASSPGLEEKLEIAPESNIPQFQKELREHQGGKTDYPTFCRISANYGVEKWTVSLTEMTCTYYDRSGNEILVESIPELNKL